MLACQGCGGERRKILGAGCREESGGCNCGCDHKELGTSVARHGWEKGLKKSIGEWKRGLLVVLRKVSCLIRGYTKSKGEGGRVFWRYKKRRPVEG